jgi:hypothetical protein
LIEVKMKVTYMQKSALEILQLAISGKLNCDPIGQRPPTSQGHGKSTEIIRSLLSGVGIGMITLRDISQSDDMQKIYPGVDYLVIDGGHRIRALVKFYQNKFAVDNKKFKELNIDLDQFMIALDITECTSQEAIEKFRNLNQTTPVNPMEMLMCDDQSEICRTIRSITRYYPEYENTPHALFETWFDKSGDEKSRFFDMAPNNRRKWDEYAFLALIKCHGGGNVDAGIAKFYHAVEKEYNGICLLNKTALKNVSRFLDDAHGFAAERKPYKLNTDIFAAFQLVWFALFEKNKNFKIDNYGKFYQAFMTVYSLLTGNADTSYNKKTITYRNEIHLIKEFIRKNMTNFANSSVQKEVAKYFLNEFSSDPADYGVIFRESKRSLTTSEREQKLAIQGYKCAIDGEPLRLEDSVWGHDTAWAQGGELMDGAVIRKTHNRDMGTTTLNEYRMILEVRRINRVAV